MYTHQHLTDHFRSDVFRLRCTGCYHISRNYLHIAHLHRLQTAKTQVIDHLQCCDQIVIKADLECCFFQSILLQKTGKCHNFLMLYFNQCIFTDSIRHQKCLLASKGFFYNKSALFLIILHIWIHHFIQHRPYIESKLDRIRVCSRHRKISTIFHMCFCHPVKQMGCRILCKDIDHTRIDTKTDHCHLSLFLPLFMPIKIIFCHRFRVAVLNTKAICWFLHRNRPGSHIGIISSGFIGSIKNIVTGKWRCRIHHKVNLMLLDQVLHLFLVCCIDLRIRKALICQKIHYLLRSGSIIVPHQHIRQPFSLWIAPF